ncbi:hypothetical protein [Oceanobacillus locisalsi]|uniref:DUF4132 domain-containing protein n=1 Tax=Oceanobacillus locisalsi TaxID=546107 RepID=A0ABW3NKX6_9BACI
MNYRDFMKQVDDSLATVSEEEKDDWIRETARKTHETQRQKFLDSLMNIRTEINYPAQAVINEIEAWCEEIENQNIYIECTGYEAYGESRYGEWINEYTDVFEVGKTLSEAFQTAEDLLYLKEYKQSHELFERLCSMEFTAVDVEVGEEFELELEELIAEDLADIDLKDSMLHLMYAAYQVFDGKDRVNTLYRYFISWRMTESIKVEEVFIVGPEELHGISAFMEEWISYLKKKDGDLAGRLLTEACMYQGGVHHLVEVAQSVSKRHPILYKNACEYYLREAAFLDCEKVGLQAIRLLPQKLVLRGQIADLTAKAAIQLGNGETVKECYEAAFYAESTISHYVRLFELPGYEQITRQAAGFAAILPENRGPSFRERKNEQLRMNTLSEERKKAIHFFNQEFDEVMKQCQNSKIQLGWSSHFKGVIVPLFVLMLNKNKQLPKAGQKLLKGIAIRLGDKDEEKSFTERFLYWKEKIDITDEQYETYAAWLQKEIDKRTESVVGGGYRKSYYKPAELIAAFGEAMESSGEANGKAEWVEHFRKAHSRKRAFKAELNALS